MVLQFNIGYFGELCKERDLMKYFGKNKRACLFQFWLFKKCFFMKLKVLK